MNGLDDGKSRRRSELRGRAVSGRQVVEHSKHYTTEEGINGKINIPNIAVPQPPRRHCLNVESAGVGNGWVGGAVFLK